MVTNIINLTPHAIVLHAPNGMVTTIESTGIARLEDRATATGDTAAGVPILRQDYGPLIGLPDPRPGTLYILSALAAQAAARAGRTDVVSPGDLVRDPEGRVIGCGALIRPA